MRLSGNAVVLAALLVVLSFAVVYMAYCLGYAVGRASAPGVRQAHQIQAAVDAGFSRYLHELADKVDADTRSERAQSK